jgi:PAS domain S-box-containing protein
MIDREEGPSTNESTETGSGTRPQDAGAEAAPPASQARSATNDDTAPQAAAATSLDLGQLLLDSVLDYAIFVLDPTGRVLTWNAGAERLKGWSAEEIIGRSFTNFYPPEVVESGWPQRELEYARRDGRFEDEGWRVRKDGSRFWANVTFTTLYSPDGRLVGFAKVTRDLTLRHAAEEQARKLAVAEAERAEAARRSEELERLNDQLQEQAMELETQAEELTTQNEELLTLSEVQRRTNTALEVALERAEASREEAARSAAAAEEAYRELDQFAYVASHDLKAPLRGIANLAQWIQDDLGQHLGEESAEHMRLLQGRVRRMEALIDGILAYSRAGRAPSKVELVDVGHLVRDVVELLAPGESVATELPAGMPTVEAERVPLQQVFMNLIGNAVKFTRAVRPDPVVRLDWRDDGDEYEFSVSDNGPGIPPEYHERIWGIFQTLEARDKVEGTGIGLSVVKKIVEGRGGRVWLESSPGAGATFHFSWPRTMRGSSRS